MWKYAITLATVLAVAIGAVAIAEDSARSNAKKPRIQAALLLDTSNSMDGLINQAKSELWRIVNELVTARQNGELPQLQVSLFEYGNNGIPAEVGHVRQILPLTDDLDAVSEKLFALTTNGGNEFCGQVIQRAVEDLQWSPLADDLKIIVIAGNEPFSQGPIDYHTSCRSAIAKGIIVNTIHCGEGTPKDWREGASLADGRAMNIDQNKALVHVDAPQDKEIVQLSEQLNTTYIAFGAKGAEGQVRQVLQDTNAANVSAGSATQRALCKANAFYMNSTWDLVDAVREKKVDLTQLKDEELPENLRKMAPAARATYVAKQQQCREEIQTKINELNKQREQHVAQVHREAAATGKQTLDQAITAAIREQASARKFEFGKGK